MSKNTIYLFILFSFLTLIRSDENVHHSNNTDEITTLINQELLHLNNTENHSLLENHSIHTQNMTELKKEEEAIAHMEDNEKFTEKLISEMGLNQGNISKDKLKNFLLRLITKDEDIDDSEKEFYGEVIERISKDIADEFDHTDLHKYIDHSNFVRAIDSVIADKYGQDVLNQLHNEARDDSEKAEL
jgi:hypothetical protein